MQLHVIGETTLGRWFIAAAEECHCDPDWVAYTLLAASVAMLDTMHHTADTAQAWDTFERVLLDALYDHATAPPAGLSVD